ncbi:alpha/beta fold hydrolase [Undibacterium sp. Xuan67W]|uniref:alpha/beta fold hydrolase n=1 Tax=Undibacterium sp. Xuan67W TaxID=3413057 RepID=UPI003BF233EA
MSVQRKSVQCLSPAGLHRVSYKEWGDPRNSRVLLCVHGVTRVADDFDALAEAMSDTYRVVCPDIVGRGQSDWLRNPQFYQIPQYVSDMVTLLARLDADVIDWFGTSMGGLIGMGMAALPDNPIRKLLLNDVGPVLNPAAIARIADYIGQDMRFASFDEGAAYIRLVSASFGPHTEAQWHKLATDVLRQNKEGQWIRHYDLNLSIPIKATTPEMALAGQAMLWVTYDAIQCQTLVVRGAESDLLSAETAAEMQQRGPRAKVVELAGVGHAPTFVQPEQIAIAREFLLT